MGSDRRRIPLIAAAILVAVLVLLFPPWRASAIRTTVRYAAVPGVAAATVIDTVQWTLALAPLYHAPRATLNGDRMRELATLSLSGDSAARAELRRAAATFEGRYHVPEVLRVPGALWRDSVLSRAGIPSVTSYDLTFGIDQRWLAGRLIVIALTCLLLIRRFGARPMPRAGIKVRDAELVR